MTGCVPRECRRLGEALTSLRRASSGWSLSQRQERVSAAKPGAESLMKRDHSVITTTESHGQKVSKTQKSNKPLHPKKI